MNKDNNISSITITLPNGLKIEGLRDAIEVSEMVSQINSKAQSKTTADDVTPSIKKRKTTGIKTKRNKAYWNDEEDRYIIENFHLGAEFFKNNKTPGIHSSRSAAYRYYTIRGYVQHPDKYNKNFSERTKKLINLYRERLVPLCTKGKIVEIPTKNQEIINKEPIDYKQRTNRL